EWQSLAMNHPCKVHQTGRVIGHKVLGGCLGGKLEFVLTHGDGDFGEFNGESSPEATAHLVPFHLYEIDAAHLAQQLPRLLLNAQLAQKVTGIVVRHAMGEACPNILGLQNVHQEFRELKEAVAELLAFSKPVRVGREKFGVKHAHHRGAGTRGAHHIVRIIKKVEDL